MIKLRFIPIFEDDTFIRACSEYEQIWTTEGSRILESFKKLTGLSIQEDRIAVLVYEGVSFSGRNKKDVMKLRASYEHDVKKGTLIHELSHRLTFHIHTDSSEEEHKFINLFLYDVWIDLYGEDFASKMVNIESERSEMYKRSWEYALKMSFNERQNRLLHSRRN